MKCLKASVYLAAISVDLIKYITSFHKSCLMSLEQQNYSKTTIKQLLASLHLKICCIWRYHTTLKCIALFNYLPYQKKKILLMSNLLLFSCYSYDFLFPAHRQEWAIVFFLQQRFTYVRIFVTYFLRSSELFIFYSQTFLEHLQSSLLLLPWRFQAELNLSDESAVTRTGRILFQDLTRAVKELILQYFFMRVMFKDLDRERERLGGLQFL